MKKGAVCLPKILVLTWLGGAEAAEACELPGRASPWNERAKETGGEERWKEAGRESRPVSPRTDAVVKRLNVDVRLHGLVVHEHSALNRL